MPIVSLTRSIADPRSATFIVADDVSRPHADPVVLYSGVRLLTVRQVDRWWWILFGVGLAANMAVIAGVYAGWQPPALVFAGLASYTVAWSLGYHRLEVRPPWHPRKQWLLPCQPP